ncbi:kinase-like domain-containing protein, partial [Syncephalis plumigaleata]
MLREEAVCEVECHQLVQNHSNVLPILDYIWRDDDMFIVLEYCPNGDLFNALIRLNSNPAVTQQERERLVVPILHDILHSIRWCHANNIWHRDIKPENVLLASDGRAFLADFGLATKERQTLDRNIGSAFYMAPELLAAPYQYLGSGYVDSEKVDIWALGVLLINMLCGRNPWEKAQYHDASFQLYLQDPEVLRNSFHFSDDGWYVIRRMLSVDPCERPTIEQV